MYVKHLRAINLSIESYLWPLMRLPTAVKLVVPKWHVFERKILYTSVLMI